MKKVISVGFNIPGCEKCYQDYLSKHSLFDADIIVFKPFSFDQYIQNVSQIVLLVPHLQGLDEQYGKEMREILADGKNIFLFMGEYQEIGGYNNYGFLPIRQKMVIISRKGSEIKFSNERIFCTFWKELNSYLNYECYIDYPHNPINRIFTTNSSDKLLGGILSYGLGNLIFLPMIKFPDDSKQAEGLGKRLIQILVDIDKSLRSKSEKTPSPEWLNSSIYTLTSESEIEKKMDSVSQEIDALNEKMDNLQTLLSDERSLKDLLFESGKPLEYAVIKALKLLGYKAENFDDSKLELDQVIISPEGDRFIGETEGKDNYAVNIDKFRQLESNISEDLLREDVSKSAIAILFGNGFRLTEPDKREEVFSEKCIDSAKIKNYILIRTPDLFRVAKYINENNDSDFAKKCRATIKSSMGKIVEFPEIQKL